MEKIWISEFKSNPDIIKNSDAIVILVPYGEDYENLKKDMLKYGFIHTSTRFVGPDLMDTEQNFRKI